jgi:hypothetical protein
MGRYGPQVSITRFDTAPRELEWQLPLDGELYRLIPGPDRPDYSLLVLERPLHFYPAPGFDIGRVEADQRVEDRKGRPMVRVHALLVCARFVGQQLQPGMHDLAVNIAYVIDNSLARDALVDFSKIEVAAVGFISEGHRGRLSTVGDAAAATTEPAETAEPSEPSEPSDTPGDTAGADAPDDVVAGGTADDVVADAARVLRDGVAAHRGRPVDRLSATLVVGADHRLAGLSGNADGEAPVPTPETFEQVNGVLSRLAGLDEGAAASASETTEQPDHAGGSRRFTVRVEGDSVVLEKSSGASA